MLLAVIDGLGGGIGSQLIGQIKDNVPAGSKILALGTNSAATQAMISAGAQRGATGETPSVIWPASGYYPGRWVLYPMP